MTKGKTTIFESVRVEYGITRPQLAQKADLSEKTVYRLERGTRTCAPVTISRAVRALGSLVGENYTTQNFFNDQGKPLYNSTS